MDALECIATRRSIRRFLEVPVDQETILTVVDAGTRAPNCGNVQDWRFIVIDDRALMKTISSYSLGQECVHNAAFLIVICSDPEQSERHYGLRGQKLYTVQNCAAAAENMLLAAHAIGLGGTWVGAFDEGKLSSLLGIPGSVRPQAILAFGFPAEEPDRKTMLDLGLVTYFNGYGSKIKNVHRLLNDYHVEWAKRINQAHTTLQRLREKASKAAKETGEKAKTKGGSLFDKYREKISESIKTRKKR